MIKWKYISLFVEKLISNKDPSRTLPFIKLDTIVASLNSYLILLGLLIEGKVYVFNCYFICGCWIVCIGSPRLSTRT